MGVAPVHFIDSYFHQRQIDRFLGDNSHSSHRKLTNEERTRHTEEAAFNKFLLLKGLNLNVRQGAYLTGWVGAIAGQFIANFDGKNSDEELESTAVSFCFELTGLPGRVIGLATSPGRMGQLYFSRKFHYISTEVHMVCEELQKMLPELKTYDDTDEETARIINFKEKIDNIIKKYGSPAFFQSTSSYILIDYLTRHPKHEVKANKLIEYLTATEVPLSIFNWKTENHAKNQGKRLFNIVMEEFKELFDSSEEELA